MKCEERGDLHTYIHTRFGNAYMYFESGVCVCYWYLVGRRGGGRKIGKGRRKRVVRQEKERDTK